jgi:hypothetical protein
MSFPAYDEEGPRQQPGRRIQLSSIPPAPRQASPEAKRLILSYQGSQWVMLIMGIAFLTFGAIFPVVFCWGLPVDLAIDVSGQTVQGRGMGATLNRSVRINRAHPTRVRFAYEVDGQSYTGEVSTFDSSTIAAGTSGGPLFIEVAGVDPSWARVEGTTYAAFGYSAVFSALFPFIGFALFRSAVRSNRREVAAFTHGVPARATVVFAGEDTTTKVNGRHPLIVRWSFTLNGQEYTGSLSGFDRDFLERFAEGDEVAVLYLPEEPSTNTLYVA